MPSDSRGAGSKFESGGAQFLAQSIENYLLCPQFRAVPPAWRGIVQCTPRLAHKDVYSSCFCVKNCFIADSILDEISLGGGS